jgi:hypothetical protein
MRARDPLDDGQAETRAAAPAARWLEAREGAFQALGFSCRDARPAIEDVDLDAAAGAAGFPNLRSFQLGAP